jgi:hypothetical protein
MEGKAVNPGLQRLADELVSLQVQLNKLDFLAKRLGKFSNLKQEQDVLDTIRHHRAGMLESSKTVAERIERICR